MKINQLKGRSVGIAVSGGLDSCTITRWLVDHGVDVFCFTADLGQPDEKDMNEIRNRMLNCGALDSTVVVAVDQLAEAGLQLIQAQATYEGGYWNTTGIARPVTVKAILDSLNNEVINVLFHGATGRGNDQVRFQLTSNMLQPDLDVYAPWRDQEFLDKFPGRQQMIEYCELNNLPIRPAKESRYSTEANFLGLTHEAGDLEDVSISPDFVEPGMGVWPWDAPDKPEYVTVYWDQGVPKSINGVDMNLIGIFEEANIIAGRNGVGIGTHVVENRFVGIKSRGIYESPAMELLGRSWEYVLQFVLDRRAREFYTNLSNVISTQIYQGYWLDSATTSALAALTPLASMVTGTIQVKLYKGNIFFDSIDDSIEKMPSSLYTDDGSMEAMGGYDHKDAEGFLNVLGVSAKNLGSRQLRDSI